METIRTFRGFDTQADALTFKRFLLSIGYGKIDLQYNEISHLWRVYFNC